MKTVEKETRNFKHTNTFIYTLYLTRNFQHDCRLFEIGNCSFIFKS